MDSIKNYLVKMIPPREDWMCSLETFASEHRIPIMETDSMNFLTQLVRIHRPATILEIGTAIGYSALRMHETNPMATITTLEKNETMYQHAVKNIQAQKKSQHINVILGDALHTIEQLVSQGDQYDFIFIDAAKGQYQRYFTAVQPLIHAQGIIVCDNILFKGYVADESKAENNRIQKIANKIRTFNDWLVKQADYHTSIIPIGDGVSISIKR
ncbi:O-methyltransferase [Pseudogracilibacillus auburnensis]|uniref:tRNA 5-hydroxyuridine methyltransferase n=1 Tax=Pseudogracilibacillus auburnensis TaxID=1494959 RepID=A0A2V3W2T8_9BACI|nr:O-methyltransferase [Pseudogracilibacillus auburnensis]PXW86575.1 putative O-methyltransferase YrrM [Pseudogracilibacillus auburnensis]